MDSATVLIIALAVGIFLISYVLKLLFYKGYDKARNSYVTRKNAQKPTETVRLSDQHTTLPPK